MVQLPMNLEYPILVIFHVLGAAIWIGALVSFVLGTLPAATRTGDLSQLKSTGKIVLGRVGFAALVVQALTGIRLAGNWINWSTIFKEPNGHLILTKIVLLVVLFGLGGFLFHRTLPRLEPDKLGGFVGMTWLVLILSLVVLVLGVGVRVPGFLGS